MGLLCIVNIKSVEISAAVRRNAVNQEPSNEETL
jgi:hypothetical protein